MTRRTIANVIRDTERDRLLVAGRPVVLGPGLGLALGLSVGFETVRGGLVDANGVLHHETEEVPSPRQLEGGPDVLMARLRAVATRVLRDGLADESLWSDESSGTLRLLGAAAAWPCPVDRQKRPGGTVLRDGWIHDPIIGIAMPTLTERLAAALGSPFSAGRCHALNDANANTLAVAFDDTRARAHEDDDERWRVALVVRVGGGIGVGTIALAPHTRGRLSFIDSRLIEGANGFAGELGHLTVDRKIIDEINEAGKSTRLAPLSYDDWLCSCTRQHHLEVFASGTTLERRLRASGIAIPPRGAARANVINAALSGDVDELLVNAVRDIGRVLGRALAGPILMLDPHRITITGSLANEHLVEGIRRERDAWDNAIDDSVELRCEGGDRGAYAGVRGAALAVVRRKVYREFLDVRDATRPVSFQFGQEDFDLLAEAVP